MDAFNRLAESVPRLWNNASLSARIAVVATALLLVVTVVGTGIWSSIPDYKLLRDGISPQLTAKIKSVLDGNGIPNRMNFAGTGVKVPSSRWNEANVAIADLSVPDDASRSRDPGSGLFPQPPSHQEQLRSKERALERTIGSLRSVKSADVHLAMPEKSPFRSKRAPTTASIVVEPQDGGAMSRELSTSIRYMVASAVEGLSVERVTLASADGMMIGNPAISDPATRRREFIRALEAEKAMKAQEVLSAVLGPQKAIVRVTAEVDDYLERTVTFNKIDASGKVRVEETITSSDQKSLPSTSGVAGTGSNGAGSASTSAAGGQLAGTKESNETTYDYPRSVETTQQVGGKLLRLWVSATVDVTSDDSAAGADPTLTQQQVEDTIKNAIGFDSARGDQIQVTLAEISDSPALVLSSEIPESEKWAFALQLARHASLGLAAVVALLIATMTLKKLQPVTIAAPTDSRRNDLLSELSTRVDQNPEAVARVLSAWLGQTDADGGESATVKKAA